MMVLSALRWLVPTASAQVPPPTPCPPILPGCGGPTNILVTNFIPQLVLFLLRVAGAIAVVMIVWYGLSLVMNLGDEQKITRGRYAVLYACLGLGLIITSQLIVSFVTTEYYGQLAAGDLVLSVLGAGVRVMLNLTNVIFVFILVYYGARMVWSQGKADDYTRARTGILWTVIGAVFVNLAHAVVRIVTSFFGI